jgi:hypothetical protein
MFIFLKTRKPIHHSFSDGSLNIENVMNEKIEFLSNEELKKTITRGIEGPGKIYTHQNGKCLDYLGAIFMGVVLGGARHGLYHLYSLAITLSNYIEMLKLMDY